MFFLVVVFCFAVTVVKGQADCICTHLATTGNCDFYQQCVEARLQCGENGYPLAYGNNYCRQFEAEKSCFTAIGRPWLRNTRCLMESILNSQVYQSSGTCDELETFAFSSHPTCFVDNGFCSDILLSLDNLRCLVDNVLQGTDSFNRLSIQQVFDTATRCSRQAADSFLSTVDDWISTTAPQSVISELLQTLKGLFEGCNGLDIVFVLDSSGSVPSTDFTSMTNFIANELIPHFNIGPDDDDTRVGVIRYSSDASVVIPLGSINNATLLQSSIRNIGYIGQGTATHLALNLTIAAFNNASDRTSQGIPKVAIVFTDGRSNNPTATIQVAQLVHDAGIAVYSFGIGSGIDETELNAIASAAENIFQIADFSSSEFASILLRLEASACTTPAIAFISEPLETSLEMGESRFLQYPFSTEEGITIKMDIFVGEVQVFGSFTIRNPTSLTADFSVQSTSDGIVYYISPDLYQSSTGASPPNDSGSNKYQQRQNDSQLSNITVDTSVYLSIIGLLKNNSFSLNTTFADTSAALALKAVYQIPLFAVLLTIMAFMLQ